MNDRCKIDARKRGAKIMNSAPKGRQNGSRNRENINKHLGSKLNAKTTLPGEIDFQLQSAYFGPRNTSLVTFKPLLFVSGALSKDILKMDGV